MSDNYEQLKLEIDKIWKSIRHHDDEIVQLKLADIAYSKDNEAFMNQFRLHTKAIDDLQNSFNDGMKLINNKFVSKEILTAKEQEGKYQKLVFGLIGAIITFVALAGIGLVADLVKGFIS
jgi:hypothetical protein